MASSLPSVLVLDHSFIRRLRDDLCRVRISIHGPLSRLVLQMTPLFIYTASAAVILGIEWNPGDSNSEGEQETVRVSGVSSYRGRLKYLIFQVNN